MLKNLLSRAAAITAGALLGLTTLLAATPAQADGATYETDVSGGTPACNTTTGEWTVTWVITNNWSEQARVDKLTTAPAPVPGLADGGYLNRRQESGTVGKTIFKQVLKDNPAEASVSFVAVWGKNKDSSNTATVQLGKCEIPEPPCVDRTEARFHHEFAIKDGAATASVTLDGALKLCTPEPVTLVTYYAPKPQFSVPQYVFASQTATLSNEQRSVTLAAKLPACYTQADLFFGGEADIISPITETSDRYDDLKLGSRNGLGSRSEGPPGRYNGGDKGCHQPKVQPVSQCDGTVDVNLSNPGEQTKYPVNFTVKAGEFTKTVTVAPGKGETVRVPAGSGPITVSAEGMKDLTYEWQRPENCAPPTVTVQNDCEAVAVLVTNPQGAIPAQATVVYGDESKQVTVAPGTSERVLFPAGEATQATVTFEGLNIEPITVTINKPDCGGGEGGGLPVTGAATGAITGGAAALLVAGGVLFLVARRRRITFTP
ncbi:cell wall anchor protein [Actinoplanes sp. NPDC049599]|uniref:cell wall anchor protein n=1 Tax=Actinoplanes sp. NPDC049599 TaxID=3363903 RepID=UPI003793252D